MIKKNFNPEMFRKRHTYITGRFAKDLEEFVLVHMLEQGIVESGAIIDNRVQINQWFVQIDLVQCPLVYGLAV